MSSTSTWVQGAAGVVLIAAGIVIDIYTGGNFLIYPGASMAVGRSRRALAPCR